MIRGQDSINPNSITESINKLHKARVLYNTCVENFAYRAGVSADAVHALVLMRNISSIALGDYQLEDMIHGIENKDLALAVTQVDESINKTYFYDDLALEYIEDNDFLSVEESFKELLPIEEQAYNEVMGRNCNEG